MKQKHNFLIMGEIYEEIVVKLFQIKPVAKPAFLLLGFGTYDKTTRGLFS